MAYHGSRRNVYDKDGVISAYDQRRLNVIIDVTEETVTKMKKQNKDKDLIEFYEDELRFLKEFRSIKYGGD